LPGDALLLLDFAREDFAIAIDLHQIIVSQAVPSLLDFAADLLPFTGDEPL
jgi:hypothetical protein